ncbi:MAG: CPBP family intramembrane glutamic endopeptidase, partial [Bacteroidota bacterium]
MEEISNSSLNSPIWLKKIGLIIIFFICFMMVVSLFSYAGELFLVKYLSVDESTTRKLIKTDSHVMLLYYLFNFTASVFVIYFFWRLIIKKDFFSIGFNDSQWLKNLILGLLCGIISISLGFTICLIFGFVKVHELIFSFTDIANYLIIFVLVAISEELMTRGLMLSTLMDGMNDYLALLIVALIFGALHLFNDKVTLLSFINISIAGLFLGISYVHNRSLWFPIGLHFSWNFFQGPVFGYEVSGHKNASIIRQTIHGNDTFTGGEFGFEGSIIAMPIMLLAIFAIHIYYSREAI